MKEENKATYKKVQALFDAMMALGIKEIFISKQEEQGVYDNINTWFMSRSKSVPRDRYVWFQGSAYPDKSSFVREGKTDKHEDQLKITITEGI